MIVVDESVDCTNREQGASHKSCTEGIVNIRLQWQQTVGRPQGFHTTLPDGKKNKFDETKKPLTQSAIGSVSCFHTWNPVQSNQFCLLWHAQKEVERLQLIIEDLSEKNHHLAQSHARIRRWDADEGGYVPGRLSKQHEEGPNSARARYSTLAEPAD